MSLHPSPSSSFSSSLFFLLFSELPTISPPPPSLPVLPLLPLELSRMQSSLGDSDKENEDEEDGKFPTLISTPFVSAPSSPKSSTTISRSDILLQITNSSSSSSSSSDFDFSARFSDVGHGNAPTPSMAKTTSIITTYMSSAEELFHNGIIRPLYRAFDCHHPSPHEDRVNSEPHYNGSDACTDTGTSYRCLRKGYGNGVRCSDDDRHGYNRSQANCGHSQQEDISSRHQRESALEIWKRSRARRRETQQHMLRSPSHVPNPKNEIRNVLCVSNRQHSDGVKNMDMHAMPHHADDVNVHMHAKAHASVQSTHSHHGDVKSIIMQTIAHHGDVKHIIMQPVTRHDHVNSIDIHPDPHDSNVHNIKMYADPRRNDVHDINLYANPIPVSLNTSNTSADPQHRDVNTIHMQANPHHHDASAGINLHNLDGVNSLSMMTYPHNGDVRNIKMMPSSHRSEVESTMPYPHMHHGHVNNTSLQLNHHRGEVKDIHMETNPHHSDVEGIHVDVKNIHMQRNAPYGDVKNIRMKLNAYQSYEDCINMQPNPHYGDFKSIHMKPGPHQCDVNTIHDIECSDAHHHYHHHQSGEISGYKMPHPVKSRMHDLHDGSNHSINRDPNHTNSTPRHRGESHRRARSLSPLRVFNIDDLMMVPPRPSFESHMIYSSTCNSSSSNNNNSEKFTYPKRRTLEELLKEHAGERNDGKCVEEGNGMYNNRHIPCQVCNNSKGLFMKDMEPQGKGGIYEAQRTSLSSPQVNHHFFSGAHHQYTSSQRAQAEVMKKRTLLPYRHGLMGCLGFFTSMKSLHVPSFHSISKRQ